MTRDVISTAAYPDQNDLCPILQSCVGCYWGHMFAGALCYADDLVLLAPYASALRRMLSVVIMLVIVVCCSILVRLSLYVLVLIRIVFFCHQ